MIKTVLADYFFMGIIGLSFAWQHSEKLKAKYLKFMLLFITIFCLPISLICYLIYPDWCWAYLVDTKKISLIIIIPIFFSYYMLALLSFLGGLNLEKKEKGLCLKVLEIIIFAFLIFSILTFKRLFYIGQTFDFYTNNLIFILQVPFFSLFVLGGITIATLAMLYIFYYLKEHFSNILTQEFDLDLNFKVAVNKVNANLKDILKDSLTAWGGIDYLKNLLKVLVFIIYFLSGFSLFY